MATYLYETIPQNEGETARRFEWKQSMKESALTHHPETGEPVRRVITGGAGLMGLSHQGSSDFAGNTAAFGGGGSCGTGCGCHH